MRIIDPKAEIMVPVYDLSVKTYMLGQMKMVESIGRKCYKSEDKITADSYDKFIRMLVSKGHEAMIEHGHFSVCFTVDRGVSHELVRHRLASWAQESTRYCNYSNDKFGGEITVIKPFFFDEGSEEYDHWFKSMMYAESAYIQMLHAGRSPQEARSVLPNSLKTEVVMTANFREWRNFFKLRADKTAHPQMRQVVKPLLEECIALCPSVFDDLYHLVE